MDYTIRNVKIEDLDQVTEVEALCFPTAGGSGSVLSAADRDISGQLFCSRG